MTAQLLKAKIKTIKDMGSQEIGDFAKELSMSQVNDKARYFLSEAIDIRIKELQSIESPMAVSSEISYD